MYPEGPLFILRGDPLSINCTVTTGDSSTTAYNLSVNLIEGSTGQRRELGNVSTYYPEAGTVSVNIPETTLEDNGTYMCNYEGMFKSLKVVSIGGMLNMGKYMSGLMGKPTICIGENKDADQLRGNREADQRLCFRYSDSTIPLLLKSEISCF